MSSAEAASVVKTQQLCLYSQIAASRHDQVLQILAGITGSHPSSIFEQRLVFEQLKAPAASKKNHTAGNLRRTYQQLIRDADSRGAWRHRVSDVPEPGVKQIISQAVSETTINDTELDKFRTGSDTYRVISQHYVHGVRFVHSNVVVSIITIHPDATDQHDPLERSLPSDFDSPSLDPSGSYVVEAMIRVEEGSGTALRDQATKELLAFAEMLKGAIDFHVPDRLALDPRIKGA